MNRRLRERREYRVDVRVLRDGVMIDAFSEDLSAGGMRLVLPVEEALEVGDTVELSFTLPGLPRGCLVRGAVRWVDRAPGRAAGIHFTSRLGAREVTAVNRLLFRPQA